VGTFDAGDDGAIHTDPPPVPDPVPPDDSQGKILAQITGQPHEMRVDSSGVYLTAWDPHSDPSQDVLYRVPLDGGLAVNLVEDFNLYAIALDADAAYVAAGPSGRGGGARILRIAKIDGSKIELTTTCNQDRQLRAIALDATHVYFGCGDTYSTPEIPGFIARMPKTGGPVEMLAPTVWWPSSIVIDGGTMFFAEEGGGSVESCPVADCGAPTMRAPSQWHPHQIALVGSSLVWGAGQGTVHTFIWTMPTADGAAPTALVADDWSGWLDADASGVYWNINGTLWRTSLTGAGSSKFQTGSWLAGPIALTMDAVFHAPYQVDYGCDAGRCQGSPTYTAWILRKPKL
jgi:hypothetical protein